VNAAQLLAAAGLEATPHRLLVYETVLAAGRALAAPELLELPALAAAMNKVTLYRILDALAAAGLLLRSTGGDRAARYCPTTSDRARGHEHGHFACTACGAVECLDTAVLPMDCAALGRLLAREVRHVELRLEGVCPACRLAGRG
jgi:Fe2+ or Zn2+ uptake regulation protein